MGGTSIVVGKSSGNLWYVIKPIDHWPSPPLMQGENIKTFPCY